MQNTVLQKNIKNKLEEKKISVAELERRAGLRYAVINILHGRSKNPSIHIAHSIAKELGCSIEDLLVEKSTTTANTNGQLPPPTKTSYQPFSAATAATEPAVVLPWDKSLATEALAIVSEYLLTNKLTADIKDIFNCIKEIYQYSYENNAKSIDKQFSNWLTKKLPTILSE